MSTLTPSSVSSVMSPSGASARTVDLDVEIFGPPGSGKSVLLASLYATLDKENQVNDLVATKRTLDLYAGLLKGDGTEITIPWSDKPEELGFTTGGDQGNARRIRIISSAGEELKDQEGNIDVDAWVQRCQNKLVVACLNPFRIDVEFGYKGLRHLIAVFQSPRIGLDLLSAVESAVSTLFQMSLDEVISNGGLAQLLTQFRFVSKLTYNPLEPDASARFAWTGVTGQQAERLDEELRDLVSTRIRLFKPLMNVVYRGIERLPHSMAVLTHIDLIDALLPSITFSDIERVFDGLFKGRPERLQTQQCLARFFKIRIEPAAGALNTQDPNDPMAMLASMRAAQPDPNAAAPANGQGKSGKYSGGIRGYFRDDGAKSLADYLRIMAMQGLNRRDEDPIVLKSENRRLNGELSSERANAERLKAAKQQLEAELAAARTENQGLHDAAIKFGNEHRQKQDELDEATRKLTSATQRVSDLERERDEFRKQLSDADGKIRGAQSLADKLRQLEEGMTGVQKELDARSAQLAQLQSELQNAQLKSQEWESRHSASEREKATLQSQLAALQSGDALRDLERFRGENQQLMADSQQLRDENRNLKMARDDARRRLADADLQVQSLQSRIRDLESQVPQLQEDVKRIQAEAQDNMRALVEKAKAQIAQRESIIEQMRRNAQQLDSQRMQLQRELDTARRWVITPDESQRRRIYELGRLGPTKLWAVLTLRAMIVLPLLAGAAYLPMVGATGIHPNFLLVSAATAVIAVVSLLCGVVLYWAQLGPRWIWFQAADTNANMLDTLTSAGDRIVAPPDSFIMESSFLLSLFGLAIIRRPSTNDKFVTSEPEVWRMSPVRVLFRQSFLLDMLSLLALLAWIGLIVYSALHTS